MCLIVKAAKVDARINHIRVNDTVTSLKVVTSMWFPLMLVQKSFHKGKYLDQAEAFSAKNWEV